MKSKVVIAEKEAEAAEEPAPRGIPEFWFTIFRNVDMLSELVQVSTLHPGRKVGLKTGCELLVGASSVVHCGWKGTPVTPTPEKCWPHRRAVTVRTAVTPYRSWSGRPAA